MTNMSLNIMIYTGLFYIYSFIFIDTSRFEVLNGLKGNERQKKVSIFFEIRKE